MFQGRRREPRLLQKAAVTALLPPAGMLAVQKAGSGQAGWRVSATGVVTGIEAAPAVVKKLKLVGHPFKVFCFVCVLLPGFRVRVLKQVPLWSRHGCRKDSRG